MFKIASTVARMKSLMLYCLKIGRKYLKITLYTSFYNFMHHFIATAGDTSNYAFLKRICGRLTLMGKILPRNINPGEEEDIQDAPDGVAFIFPDKAISLEYLDCFFDHLNGTYRYLSKTYMITLLERVYSDDNNVLNDNAALGLLLAVLGSGYVYSRLVHVWSFDGKCTNFE
ncbi:unnamed protein product [Clonostachys rosea]|uniref:PiggyBac transposable element-derived protein domain-containing protein n=1 Tax=Bionectria ochroleuca TaxID=29856 RepID=A0ABY6TZ02_BIOOC|nr:unnamed protein product [Clonostachys rosea]